MCIEYYGGGMIQSQILNVSIWFTCVARSCNTANEPIQS